LQDADKTASVMNRKMTESLIQQANPETKAQLLAAAFVCSPLCCPQDGGRTVMWRLGDVQGF